MLDKAFVQELKRINGNGSRADKFAFLTCACAAAKEMSTPEIRNRFDAMFKSYSRATIGICIAATIVSREDRLNPETVKWAREVLSYWTNRPPTFDRVIIDDGLHPTRIEEYAASFISLTSY